MSFNTIRMFPVCAALACVAPLEVQAQTPPDCTKQTCTITLQSDRQVVDGCGNQATPGRMKMTFTSTNPLVRRTSFNSTSFVVPGKEHRKEPVFADWEWRNKNVSGNAWQSGLGSQFGVPALGLGTHIIEVRPKDGAHIWSVVRGREGNATRSAAPGEIIVHTLSLRDSPAGKATERGSAYFLFMGGRGCARVGPRGGLLGGNQ